jgi:hypothetical protein
MIMETKVCKNCGRELPIGKFYVGKNMKDGLRNECKMCRSMYNQEWRKNKLKAQQEKSTELVKTTEPLALKTKICAKCGEELPVKSFYIDKKAKSGYSSYCKKCHAVAVFNNRKLLLDKAKNSRITDFATEDLIAELKARISTWMLIRKIVFK